MNAITFSLVPVPEEIAAGRKVYRAYVKTNGTTPTLTGPFRWSGTPSDGMPSPQS